MRKIWIVGSLVGLLLALSACGSQQPAATQATVSPMTSQAAANVSPSASSSPSDAPAASTAPSAAPTAAAAPTASQKPSASAAATIAAAATPKPSAVPSASPKTTATPAPASQVTVSDDKAKALFKDNCMSCHGASLEGSFGPNLTKVGSQKSKADIIKQITSGGGDMPPFDKTLKSSEIEILAGWLATKK